MADEKDTNRLDEQALGQEGSAEQPETYRYNLDSLDDYLATGEQIAKLGRLDEAVDIMREATRRYPESPTGKYNLGVALFLRVREDKAHLELWEDLADDENLADEAIAALQDAVAQDPNFIAAYNNLGRLLALRNRPREAFAAWERSLQLDPSQETVQAEMDLYRSKLSPAKEDLEEREILRANDPMERGKDTV